MNTYPDMSHVHGGSEDLVQDLGTLACIEYEFIATRIIVSGIIEWVDCF